MWIHVFIFYNHQMFGLHFRCTNILWGAWGTCPRRIGTRLPAVVPRGMLRGSPLESSCLAVGRVVGFSPLQTCSWRILASKGLAARFPQNHILYLSTKLTCASPRFAIKSACSFSTKSASGILRAQHLDLLWKQCFRSVVLNLWVVTLRDSEGPFTQGLLKTIGKPDVCIIIHNSSRITVMK